MKISEQWLREWADPPISTERLAEQLTMAGIEVEDITPATANFSGVSVAFVDAVDVHPQADRLKICRVNTGQQTYMVVCGAENVHPNMLVPFAKPGAILPDKKVISPSTVKGIDSEGMLCSAADLGLAESAVGLLELPAEVLPGSDLRDSLSLDDTVFELCLTPNRGDCLSILGIAREVMLLNQCELTIAAINAVSVSCDLIRNIHIKETTACPRYIGRVIQNVDVSAPTPFWVMEKLRRCGLRSVNVVVDITNFVMLEFGQPLHVFDNDRLCGDIIIRYADDGECLKLLNEQEYELSADTLLIADEKGALAIAGIMGGYDSAVSPESRNIFLESAFFNPRAIVGRARYYGLHTDASHRFERGVDPHLQNKAIERASQLILDICGGEAGRLSEQLVADKLPVNEPIILRKKRIQRVLGMTVTEHEVMGIMQRLGMQIATVFQGWRITAPSFRFDLAIEADLIEEIARIQGYDNIPTKILESSFHLHSTHNIHEQTKRIRHLLMFHDYQEVITYSFVSQDLQQSLDPEGIPLILENPITPELSAMRTSLLPCLITALQYNLKRQCSRIRLFEVGLVFSGGDKITETPVVGGLICGNISGKQWAIKDREGDFFDLKKDVENLISYSIPIEKVEFRPFLHSALHPKQAAQIIIKGQKRGFMGALHPLIRDSLQINQPVFFFELSLQALVEHETPVYSQISRFPSIRRDISLLVAAETPVADIIKSVWQAAPTELTKLELFDVYYGENFDIAKKSLALGLTFEGYSRTLTDIEVESLLSSIVGQLCRNFGATLRE